MAFPTYDLTIEQGTTFKFNLNVMDAVSSSLDVTGWTFTGTIKETPNTGYPVVADFTISVTAATSGSLLVTLPASESIKLVKPRYVYDIIGKNPNTVPAEVTRIVQGKVAVNLGVTSLTDS